MSVTWTTAGQKSELEATKRELEIKRLSNRYTTLQRKKDALESKIAAGKLSPVERLEWKRTVSEMKGLESQLNVKSAMAVATTALQQTQATVKSMTTDARELTRAANQLKRTTAQIEKQAPKMIEAVERMQESQATVEAVMDAVDVTDTDELDFKLNLGTPTETLPAASFALPAVPTREV